MRPMCEIEDCDKPVRKRHTSGWCEMHYMRWHRHGDPLVVFPGATHLASNGYRHVPGTRVYEHRAVLLAKIGPGTHPCHWCGSPVSWDKHWPADPDGLVVDHLDNDKLNNDPANLVPAHNPCNSKRSARPCPVGCTCGRHRRAA